MQTQQILLLRKAVFGKASIALAVGLFLGSAVDATWAAEAPVIGAPSITADLGAAERASLNTVVSQNGAIYDINQGTQKGSVLFHGFDQFGVKAGETANFLVNSDVKNVVARVSGGATTINGTINSDSAGLWLMNPNGIIVGDGAVFKVNGALSLSTAQTLIFDDINIQNVASKFSSTSGGAAAIDGAKPAGFGFLGSDPLAANKPDIKISGHINVNYIEKDYFSPGLINLVGRNILLQNGGLQWPGSSLVVAAINGNKEINVPHSDQSKKSLSSLRPLGLYGGDSTLNAFKLVAGNDIALNGIESYDYGGAINLDNFDLAEKVYRTLPVGLFLIGKTINIDALNLAATSDDNTILEAYANDLSIENSSFISSTGRCCGTSIKPRFFAFNGLELTNFVATHFANLDGLSADGIFVGRKYLRIQNSEIGSTLEGPAAKQADGSRFVFIGGQGGLDAEKIFRPGVGLYDSVIYSDNNILTFGVPDGSGQMYFASAGDMEVNGVKNRSGGKGDASISLGILSSSDFYPGSDRFDGKIGRDLGRISIKANNLSIKNAKISADRTVTFARNGSIDLDLAGSLNIEGENSGVFVLSGRDDSKLFGQSRVFVDNLNVGSLSIKAGSVTLNDFAQLSSDALGYGAAGNIDIKADQVVLKDQSRITAMSTSQGNAGFIAINSKDLVITSAKNASSGFLEKSNAAGDAQYSTFPSQSQPSGIYSSSDGSSGSIGAPGNITVNSRNGITLDGGAIDSSSASTIQGKNSQGDINLNSPHIQLKNGALITSASTGVADAGNITLNAADKIQLSDSQVSTSAPDANGGNIAIQNGNATTNSRLLQLNKSTISASAGTNGGNITIAADTIIKIASTVKATGERGTNGDVVFTSPQLDVSTLITDLSVPVLDASRLLQQTCSAASARKASSFVVNKKPLNLAPGGYRLSRLSLAALPVADTKNSLPAKALKLPGNSIDCQSIAGI